MPELPLAHPEAPLEATGMSPGLGAESKEGEGGDRA